MARSRDTFLAWTTRLAGHYLPTGTYEPELKRAAAETARHNMRGAGRAMGQVRDRAFAVLRDWDEAERDNWLLHHQPNATDLARADKYEGLTGARRKRYGYHHRDSLARAGVRSIPAKV